MAKAETRKRAKESCMMATVYLILGNEGKRFGKVFSTIKLFINDFVISLSPLSSAVVVVHNLLSRENFWIIKRFQNLEVGARNKN